MPWHVRVGLALAALVALLAAPTSAEAATVPTVGTVQGAVTTRLEPMTLAGTLAIGSRSYTGTLGTTAASLTPTTDPTHIKYFVYTVGPLELSGKNQLGSSVAASCTGGGLSYEQYLLWDRYEPDIAFGLDCTGRITGGGPPSSGVFHLYAWAPVVTGDQYRPDVNPGRTGFHGTYGDGQPPFYLGPCPWVPLILTCSAQ
jgi:hypothetical protein